MKLDDPLTKEQKAILEIAQFKVSGIYEVEEVSYVGQRRKFLCHYPGAKQSFI